MADSTDSRQILRIFVSKTSSIFWGHFWNIKNVQQVKVWVAQEDEHQGIIIVIEIMYKNVGELFLLNKLQREINATQIANIDLISEWVQLYYVTLQVQIHTHYYTVL